MSATQLVDAVKKNTKIEPFEDPWRSSSVRSENPTIVFTVGFEYADPQTATQVANELVTRILSEDLRDRTSRATDTTQFLTKRSPKTAGGECRDRSQGCPGQAFTDQVPQTPPRTDPPVQLAQLRADYAQKSALYSDQHPIMQAMKRQIAALEKVVGPAVTRLPPTRSSKRCRPSSKHVRRIWKRLRRSLSAARLGETLERNQQSEKLEVIEQPTAPQEPIRPNRPKIAGITVVARDRGGRRSRLSGRNDRPGNPARQRNTSGLSIAAWSFQFPISPPSKSWRRAARRFVMMGIASLVIVIGGLSAAYFFMPPLDLVIAKAQVGLFR